jgi:glycosyltransferase involved in cell wall biosynthesis
VKVALLIGPCPEGKCGVGDYTRLLAAALGRNGVRAEVFECAGGLALRAFRLAAEIRRFRPDVTHLQYPTTGFGNGVTPQVLSLLNRFVLAVHEMEGVHLLRRLSFYPLWARARHVIFTCESNRNYSLRWAPWLRGISCVVPLSSNIPMLANGRNGRLPAEVIHFGLVRPNKGIEDVLEFARLAHAERSPVRVRIVGSSPTRHMAYLSNLQSSSSGLPVVWDLDLSAEEVAERLARATFAYLPFPDGASERRTSLIAALERGVPVITTRGKNTPSGLQGASWFCASPTGALAAVQTLLERADLREALSSKAREYAGKFSWERAAQSHIEIYKALSSPHEAEGAIA